MPRSYRFAPEIRFRIPAKSIGYAAIWWRNGLPKLLSQRLNR